MINKQSISGSFDTLSADVQDEIKEYVAMYHYRNGVKNGDGSMGVISMTPKELRDLLAHQLKGDK